MKLVDRCLELRIFCNIIFEYLLVLSLYGYREVSGLCVPVSLRFRRDQEFYEFPCCTKLFRIVVVQCPERCTTDGNTTLIAGFDLRKVCSTNLKFSVYILKDLFQGSCGAKCDRRFSCGEICQTCIAAFSYDRCEVLVVKILPCCKDILCSTVLIKSNCCCSLFTSVSVVCILKALFSDKLLEEPSIDSKRHDLACAAFVQKLLSDLTDALQAVRNFCDACFFKHVLVVIHDRCGRVKRHRVQLIVDGVVCSQVRLDLRYIVAVRIDHLLHRHDPSGIDHESCSDLIYLYKIRTHVSDLRTFQLVQGVIIFTLILSIYSNSVFILIIEFFYQCIDCLTIDTTHGMPEGNGSSVYIGSICHFHFFICAGLCGEYSYSGKRTDGHCCGKESCDDFFLHNFFLLLKIFSFFIFYIR